MAKETQKIDDFEYFKDYYKPLQSDWSEKDLVKHKNWYLITQRKNKFALLKFIVFTVTVIPLVFQLLRGRRNSDSNIRH